MKKMLRSSLGLLMTMLPLCVPASGLAAVQGNRLAYNAAQTEARELPQGVSPRVRRSTKLGHLEGDVPLQTMSLALNPTAEQSAALDKLLADQQDPASPSYHQWLTPEQFGERFGASDHDLRILQDWLTGQGLQVTGVARSRNAITFSGPAAVVEAAFHTELDRFQRNGQTFFENATAPQVPAALTGIVGGISGLSSYRLEPHGVKPVLRAQATASAGEAAGVTATPNATSSSGTTHYMTPYDWRQIYNANSLYNAGYTGTGSGIAVLGQSAVDTAQVGYFQQLTGQAVKAPTLVLVPNTGTSTRYQGDESESELDLEYASGVAPGANITFVYTGSSTSSGVFDALQYAISQNIAPILSLSYGTCETAYSMSSLNTYENSMRQANAQGQTIMVSSGDAGAASCDDTAPAYGGLQASYPASSVYASAIGGTTFNEGTGTTYWSTTNNSQYGSALGYIPEVVWNDSTSTSLSAAGGGFSRYYSKPNWQAGTGVPADGARDIPDVSFSASTSHDAYLFCTSDPSVAGTRNGTTVNGACTSTVFGSFVVGGTSVPTPEFAGAVAMIESANGSVRLGNVNPRLYALFGSTPAIFHDVTSGNNAVVCAGGTLGCTNGTLGYNATAGYDLATGLGSVDIGALNTAITATLTPAKLTPTVAITVGTTSTTSIAATIVVSNNSSTTVPSGTVNVSVDGGTARTVTLAANGTGSSSAAITLTSSAFSAGTHTITAVYSGDTNFNTGTAAATAAVASGTGGLTLTAAPASLTINSSTAHSGTWTLTLASTGGFSGLVGYTVKGGPSTGCFNFSTTGVGVAAGGSVSSTVTYSFLASDCTSTGAQRVTAFAAVRPSRSLPLAAFGLPALLGTGLLRRRKLWMTGILSVGFLAVSMGLSGCGSGSTSLGTTTPSPSNAPKGTYTVTFTAASYPSGAVQTTATTTLVIQ